MFKGYNGAGLHGDTVALFRRMRRRDVRPNRYTFPLVIKSCTAVRATEEGEQAHGLAIKSGFEGNDFAVPALIDMYSSNGDLGSARSLFDQTTDRDVVLWNTIISGYTRRGDMTAATELFASMPDRDAIVWNNILLGYADAGDLDACERIFEEMPGHDVKPNEATLATVLSACSKLGALRRGRRIHVYAEANGLNTSVCVSNGLIDMYAKCGCIDDAVGVFDAMQRKDLVTWNSMIAGLAMHGRGADALQLFRQMKRAGERPDGITFVGALSACAHIGLVDDGLMHFRSMSEDYKLIPWVEHYGCVVDLLSRAGLLAEAVEFIWRMPMEPDCVIWSALLGACQVHRDVAVAELAMDRLGRLAPGDAANYVVLSNIYGAAGRWKDVARMKRIAREQSTEKTPGGSSIEVDSEVVEFLSSDTRHRQTWKIYWVLEGLTELSKLDELGKQYSILI
ncbi:Pentatricopeptide repeat-containing protein [Musa troglodytarum]|uniref:Pentatricopeptide repeat-containing protein n=1 Tax=Musa troglodytarum TaxID=320322 RepID=A0A9E7KUN9_9LILI|nr:Pentatricopeptide repeat-containing protein [Musa troglodytarum]